MKLNAKQRKKLNQVLWTHDIICRTCPTDMDCGNCLTDWNDYQVRVALRCDIVTPEVEDYLKDV